MRRRAGSTATALLGLLCAGLFFVIVYALSWAVRFALA